MQRFVGCSKTGPHDNDQIRRTVCCLCRKLVKTHVYCDDKSKQTGAPLACGDCYQFLVYFFAIEGYSCFKNQGSLFRLYQEWKKHYLKNVRFADYVVFLCATQNGNFVLDAGHLLDVQWKKMIILGIIFQTRYLKFQEDLMTT